MAFTRLIESRYAISEIIITISTPISAIVGSQISAHIFCLSVGSSVPPVGVLVTLVSAGFVTEVTPIRFRDCW